MKKLLKAYGFNSETQYYKMIAESVINGNFGQSILQFLAMSPIYRKRFVIEMHGLNYLGLDKNQFYKFIELI